METTLLQKSQNHSCKMSAFEKLYLNPLPYSEDLKSITLSFLHPVLKSCIL
jgi:hypothetical protein